MPVVARTSRIPTGPCSPTRALERFLAGLGGRAQPVLLDLGPVVGSNVTFFREEVGCKICLEDLPKDIDRHVTEGKLEELPAFFDTRFPYEAETIDGILCWDIFDFLDRPPAERLARSSSACCGRTGCCWRFSARRTRGRCPAPTYTKHVVVDRTHLQYRPYAAARGKQRPLLNRDIQRLLEPLRITENVLLKNNLREVLFRKPASGPDGRGTARGALTQPPMARPVIAFLTDFGTKDHYAGTMKGVVLGICPDAACVDITHDIPAARRHGGALELAAAYKYFPARHDLRRRGRSGRRIGPAADCRRGRRLSVRGA